MRVHRMVLNPQIVQEFRDLHMDLSMDITPYNLRPRKLKHE